MVIRRKPCRDILVSGLIIVTCVPQTDAQTYLFGAGSTLSAPTIRQAADCYGVKLSLAFRSVAVATDIADFSFTRSPPFNCAPVASGGGGEINPAVGISYLAAGSGRGITAFFAHDASAWPADGTGAPAPSVGTIAPAGLAPAGRLHLALSDIPIEELPEPPPPGETGSAVPGVSTYRSGGPITAGATAPEIASVAPPGVAPVGPTQLPNPQSSFGPLIQVPMLIAPIAIAFDPVYKKVTTGAGVVTEYRFAYPGSRSDGSGGLDISRATMCAIFTGEITNWGQVPGISKQATPVPDPESYAPVAGQASGNNLNIPLQIVGRLDPSGATLGFTRHLGAVCGDPFTPAPLLPAGLRGAIYAKAQLNTAPAGETPGRFTLAEGSDGVARYLDFAAVPLPGQTIKQGRIGYIGTNFVLPYARVTGINSFDLAAADIQNADGKFIQPRASAASAAFGGLFPPESNTLGVYTTGSCSNPNDAASCTLGLRKSPAARSANHVWVQGKDVNSPIADPNPDDATSQYPIVITTNALLYTCYGNFAEMLAVRDFLGWFFSAKLVNDTTGGILARSGLSPVPPAFQRAIRETFIAPVTATRGLKLRIQQAGTSPVTSGVTEDQCAAISPGA